MVGGGFPGRVHRHKGLAAAVRARMGANVHSSAPHLSGHGHAVRHDRFPCLPRHRHGPHRCNLWRLASHGGASGARAEPRHFMRYFSLHIQCGHHRRQLCGAATGQQGIHHARLVRLHGLAAWLRRERQAHGARHARRGGPAPGTAPAARPAAAAHGSKRPRHPAPRPAARHCHPSARRGRVFWAVDGTPRYPKVFWARRQFYE